MRFFIFFFSKRQLRERERESKTIGGEREEREREGREKERKNGMMKMMKRMRNDFVTLIK